MTDNQAFIQALLANPQDDALRLVYADWLEEQSNPISEAKAEFLRLIVQQAVHSSGKGKNKGRERLQQLASGLDTAWLAVVSQLAIENCKGKRNEEEARRVGQSRRGRFTGMSLVRFDYLCDRRWEDLQATENQAVRFCDGCQQNVHYCDMIMEARDHAQHGRCIAVDLGVIRREGDLTPRCALMGLPSPQMLRQEEERAKPDPVSAERELHKRQQPRG
jgi:uncharacterized protein (TIGR02996 family)